MLFAELVERNSIVNPDVSLALGVPVTCVRPGMLREPLGAVVDVIPGRAGVWVRRFSDPADVSVWYAVTELEVATSDDLAQIARTMLRWQYSEAIDLAQSARSDV